MHILASTTNLSGLAIASIPGKAWNIANGSPIPVLLRPICSTGPIASTSDSAINPAQKRVDGLRQVTSAPSSARASAT